MSSLIDLPDLGRERAGRLTALGIPDVATLLNRCGPVAGQDTLAAAGPFDMTQLRGWVRVADLLRVPGITLPLANALVAAGVLSVSLLRAADAAEIGARLAAAGTPTPPPTPDQCTALVAAAKGLAIVAELPEDALLEPDAGLDRIVTSAALLSMDGQAGAVSVLATRALTTVRDRVMTLPARQIRNRRAAALRFLSDEDIAAALAAIGSNPKASALAGALSGLDAAGFRQLADAPVTLTPGPVVPSNTFSGLALAADLLHAAVSRQAAAAPSGARNTARALDDLVDQAVATTQVAVGALKTSLATGDRGAVQAACVGELVLAEARLRAIGDALGRLRRADADSQDNAGMARRHTALEDTRREYVAHLVFTAMVLADLRANATIRSHTDRARKAAYPTPSLPSHSVAELLDGKATEPTIRLLGLRVGVTGKSTAGDIEIADLSAPNRHVRVALPATDELGPLVYKPAYCAVRVLSAGPGDGRVSGSKIRLGAPRTWRDHIARTVLPAFALYPGEAEIALSPIRSEAERILDRAARGGAL